jgi:hypothetical protein
VLEPHTTVGIGGARPAVDPKHAFPSWTLWERSAPESCRKR